MKLKEIRIENFLSFRNVYIKFSGDVNFIVGPNNSGKTNLVRTLNYVVNAITKQREYIEPEYLLYDPDDPHYEIRIGVLLDNREVRLIKNFLEMVAKYNFQGPTISTWLVEEKSENLRERKIMAINAIKRRFLEDISALATLFREFTIRVSAEEPLRIPKIELIVENSKLGRLVITDSIIFSEKTNPRSNLFLIFFEKLEKLYLDIRDSIISFLEGTSALDIPKIDVVNFLSQVLREGAIETPKISVDKIQSSKERKVFLDMLHENYLHFHETEDITLFKLIINMFANKILFLDEFRNRPTGSFPIQKLTGETLYFRDFGRMIALQLLELERSSDSESIRNYKAIKQIFSDILREFGCEDFKISWMIREIKQKQRFGELTTDRTIASIKSLLTEIGILDILKRGQTKYVVDVNILVKCGEKYLPIDFVGSGISEVLTILVLVYGMHESIIVLDEPAAHLHPSLQKKIIKFIADLNAGYNNQLIVITHSPYIIYSKHFDNIIRFYMTKEGTYAVRLSELEEFNKLKERLERIPDLRQILFARKVLVAEGYHEELLIRAFIPIDMFDIALVNANGNNNFGFYEKILKQMNITFRFACDRGSLKFLEDKNLAIYYDYEDLADLLQDLIKNVVDLPSELISLIREFIDAKRRAKEEKKEKERKKYIRKATEVLQEILARYKDYLLRFDPFREWINKMARWINAI